VTTTDLIRAHGFVAVAVILTIGLLIAALRVVALPLAGIAVLLDGAANKAATSQFLTDLADRTGGAR
jgi:hypothetical protein